MTDQKPGPRGMRSDSGSGSSKKAIGRSSPQAGEGRVALVDGPVPKVERPQVDLVELHRVPLLAARSSNDATLRPRAEVWS